MYRVQVKQVKVDTNPILQLLAKADHFGELATPNMVGLIQLFNFEFYQLKLEFVYSFYVKTDCKAFNFIHSFKLTNLL